MTLPVLFLIGSALPQFADSPAPEPAVQVWLDSEDASYERGDHARVFARTARDGYLVVLHSDAEGRVRVLFPMDPWADDYVRGAESVELLGRADREAFLVEERAGSGIVLAAWSQDPFRFDDFVRGDHWDYRTLAPARLSRDAEAGLLDIVHRMAAGRSFDFDAAPYVVGTRATGGWNYDGYVIERRTDVHVNVGYAPACFGCYDPWRSVWNVGLGWGTGSWYLNVGFGSPWYRPYHYRPWGYYPVGRHYYDPWGWRPYYVQPVRVVWTRPWRRPVGIGYAHGDPWCSYRCDRNPRPGRATGVRLTDSNVWRDIEPRAARPRDDVRSGLVQQTLRTRIAEATPAVEPRPARNRAGIAQPTAGPANPSARPVQTSVPRSQPDRGRVARALQQDRPDRASDSRPSARPVQTSEPRPARSGNGIISRSPTASPTPSDRARPRSTPMPPETQPRASSPSSRTRIWNAPPESTGRPARSDRAAIVRTAPAGPTPPPSRPERAATPSRAIPPSTTARPRTERERTITRARPSGSAKAPVARPSRPSPQARSARPPAAAPSRTAAPTTKAKPRSGATGRTGSARASGRARGSGGG